MVRRDSGLPLLEHRDQRSGSQVWGCVPMQGDGKSKTIQCALELHFNVVGDETAGSVQRQGLAVSLERPAVE
jgi:hypothetical protein